MTLSAEGATSTVGSSTCPSGDEAATTAGCVTADPLFDPTDFTPGGGDTGTVLISPLIKPGTVSSTYYNHYSTLRTLEDLFLTGKSCTNPSNADTPLAAGTVCGGLDGQGHIGYAAQAGLASFGPDVFTAEHFTAVTVPPGYAAVSGSGATALYCPVHVTLGSGSHVRQAGHGALRRRRRARPERPAAGRAAATAATAGTASRAGHGGNGGNGGNGACPPERMVQRDLAHRGRHADDATQHAALQRGGGNGGDGGNGGNGSAGSRAATAATAATDRPGAPAGTAPGHGVARRSAPADGLPPDGSTSRPGPGAHARPRRAVRRRRRRRARPRRLWRWRRTGGSQPSLGPAGKERPRSTPPSSRRRRWTRPSTPR